MRTRLAAAALAALAALALAACSSDGSGAAGYTKASDLAAKIGCTGLSPHSGVMYEKDGANCSIGSAGPVEVVIFADSSARDSWVQVAKGVAGAANLVQGDLWVVDCPDMATADAVVKATGGHGV